MISIHHCTLDPREIFGSVGRCGGGYNTVWEDWSLQGRRDRDNIIREFEQGMDGICGHYIQLEKSIIEEGFRNPIIITCGPPIHRSLKHLPPEIREKPEREWLIMEGSSGGSRLWVAQKHNIPIKCIINDQTGRFKDSPKISSVAEAAALFADPPELSIHPKKGIIGGQPSKTHIDAKWNIESVLDKERRPMWKNIMKKYGRMVR